MKYWKTFFILSILSSLFYYNVFLKEHSYEKDFSLDIPYVDNYSGTNQPHFTHMPITYKFQQGCIGPIINRTKNAFDIIMNGTNYFVKFEETDSFNSDISIYCYKSKNSTREGISLAEGGPDLVILDSPKRILSAKINFYSVSNITYPQSCFNFPLTEVHEILHVFGIGHYSYSDLDIMKPYLERDDCKWITEINREYLDCLKLIYSNQSTMCKNVIFTI